MGLDLSKVGTTLGPYEKEYNWKDVALYGLGLGLGVEDLEFLLDSPPPKVLPTFGVVPAFEPVFEALGHTGGNLVTLLHSGQKTELIKPFPHQGTMRTTAAIQGIWDMKIGALTTIDTETEVDGEKVSRTSWQLLMRGEGKFGGPRPPKLLRVTPDESANPAFSVEIPTQPSQALLYRLSGDINPIHARPEVAAEAGFDRPILHGLCFYGIAARVSLKELAGNDPARFKSFEARFGKVVLPGDTLVIKGWPTEEPGTCAITVTIKHSGEKAIANGLFKYHP